MVVRTLFIRAGTKAPPVVARAFRFTGKIAFLALAASLAFTWKPECRRNRPLGRLLFDSFLVADF